MKKIIFLLIALLLLTSCKKAEDFTKDYNSSSEETSGETLGNAELVDDESDAIVTPLIPFE